MKTKTYTKTKTRTKTKTYTVTIAADMRAYATITIEATSRDAAWQRAITIAASPDIFAEPELHGITTFKPDYDTLCEFEAHLGRYAVEAANGEIPPFRVFDVKTQNYLWETFATRAEAEFFMLSITTVVEEY